MAMGWTVGRRIAVGYAVVLLLLAVVAGVGAYALSRTAAAFEATIRRQELRVVNALEARGHSDRSVVSLLRYNITREEGLLKEREDRAADARREVTGLRDTSPTPETKAGWQEALDFIQAR